MQLHHVNIAAEDMAAMRSFFIHVVGMAEVDRPASIEFPGHWLGGKEGAESTVHLMNGGADVGPSTGCVDHIAFRGEDKSALLGRLKAHGITYRERTVAGGFAQVFFSGPEGLTVEINFPLG